MLESLAIIIYSNTTDVSFDSLKYYIKFKCTDL